MPSQSQSIAIVGAGLQGACIALELSGRGFSVDLYERNPDCLGEASAHNEGKIHLGHVYAQDRSFATSALMLQGALEFEPLITKWLGRPIGAEAMCSPFRYAIHRDSLLSPDIFETHGRRIAEHARKSANGSALTYFGRDPGKPPELVPAANLDGDFDGKRVRAVFQTEEMAIDPQALAAAVARRLADDPRINVLTNCEVAGIRDEGDMLIVDFLAGGERHAQVYDKVVNAAWTGRLALDQAFGIAPRPGWLFRHRYFLRAETGSAPRLRPVTTVIGRFGDFVAYGSGTLYLSWYPSGLSHWSTELVPPRVAPILEGAAADIVRQGTIDGLAGIMPGIAAAGAEAAEVRGSWVYAHGATDIDDPSSNLHGRTAIGWERHGGYFSVNSGKLTMAPYFAVRIADEISGG